MKLTENGGRNRNVKNTGPGICKNCRCSGPGLFIFLIVMFLESVIPDKRPSGTRSQNASFVHKGLGLSQQVLSPSETGKKARGDPGPCLRGSL